MEHYAGIDVSLELSSVCVVDATGRIVREAKVASEPEALVAWFRGLGTEGTVQRLGVYAASAHGRPEPGDGSNSWPKPEPSAPL